MKGLGDTNCNDNIQTQNNKIIFGRVNKSINIFEFKPKQNFYYQHYQHVQFG